MILACSEKYFEESFSAIKSEQNFLDIVFKNLKYDDCVIFSSGSDEFG